jgi:hypothetical protein
VVADPPRTIGLRAGGERQCPGCSAEKRDELVNRRYLVTHRNQSNQILAAPIGVGPALKHKQFTGQAAVQPARQVERQFRRAER